MSSDMEAVNLFNSELSSLYDVKPPISKGKMTSITLAALKAMKYYNHVVQSVEKFIEKCKPEYKILGLYVIDSIIRQSRHQFGPEKNLFAMRFARNLTNNFIHLYKCPDDEKAKIIRVLHLWQKNKIFMPDVITPLLDLANPNHEIWEKINLEQRASEAMQSNNNSSQAKKELLDYDDDEDVEPNNENKDRTPRLSQQSQLSEQQQQQMSEALPSLADKIPQNEKNASLGVKGDTSVMIDDFPDDLAAGLALQKLDLAISSLIKIDKIITKILKTESGKQYNRSRSWIGMIFKGLLILLLTQTIVAGFPSFKAEINESCSSKLECADCITNGCTFLEFANKTTACVRDGENVRGLRRRQFSKYCPDDLLPKEIGKWLENRTIFIEQELYGYKLYVWITIPIIVTFIAFLGFRLYKCYYHKTRYYPRRNVIVPECLRICCNRNKALTKDNTPDIDLEEVVHYENVSQYSESSSGRSSLDSSFSPATTQDDLDSTYVPNLDSSASRISDNTFNQIPMILRPRRPINYKV